MNNILRSLLGSFFFILLIFFSSSDQKHIEDKTTFFPSIELAKFTFGFDNLMANSLWLDFLQDDQLCKKPRFEKKESNLSTEVPDIITTKLRDSQCHLDWGYHILNLITELDPEFRVAYRSGAELLAIVTDDREGAKRIFDKGLKKFPNYWELNYSASYHYLYELQQPKRASELLVRAANSGGPTWLFSLAGAILAESGNKQLAISVLTEFINNNPDDTAVARAKYRLRQILSN